MSASPPIPRMKPNAGHRFRAFLPFEVISKASSPGRVKIRGILSTEHEDRQGDIIDQDGLDFGPFLSYGWFNDNHRGRTSDVLGYPERVWKTTLKDGVRATMVEGYLIPGKETDRIVELAKGLKNDPSRQLGFSVEGDIRERRGPGKRWVTKQDGTRILVGNRVTKAVVKHSAITHVPVNQQSRLEVLAKSMDSSAIGPLVPESLEGAETVEGRPRIFIPIDANGLPPDVWRDVAKAELAAIEAGGYRPREDVLKKGLAVSLDRVRARFPTATPAEGAEILRRVAYTGGP